MRQSSLSRRLMLAATAFIAIALVVAAVVIGFVLHRFIQGQIDQRLDTQIVFLTSLLRADGDRIRLAGNADGPPFDRPGRGWYWQVSGPANVIRSDSLRGQDLTVPAHRDRPPPRKDGPRPDDGIGPDDERLHFRIDQVSVANTLVTIVASAPRAAVLGPLRDAMTTLIVSLAVLGIALMLAILVQVRLGLRPLEGLRRSVSDVRAGLAERVPSKQPREVAPLVNELNLMLEQNATNLDRARRHVANLAHGLKTPLATLALAVSGDGRRSAELDGLVGLMQRRIRHHLGRARAAALSGPAQRTRTVIASRIADIGNALARIHADKPIALSIDAPDQLAVACEPQDVDEMIGNILENAFKWAGRAIHVSAYPGDNTTIALIVEDDGPGLSDVQVTQVLRPGERLDEAAPGFGFGLSITRELVELYGGQLVLDRSPRGGLRVTLTLPAALAAR